MISLLSTWSLWLYILLYTQHAYWALVGQLSAWSVNQVKISVWGTPSHGCTPRSWEQVAHAGHHALCSACHLWKIISQWYVRGVHRYLYSDASLLLFINIQHQAINLYLPGTSNGTLLYRCIEGPRFWASVFSLCVNSLLSPEFCSPSHSPTFGRWVTWVFFSLDLCS